MGIKAAHEQCHNPIAYKKSWESLQWAQPLTHAGYLSETHCLQEQSLLNKARNHIPKSILVLRV